MRQVFEASRLPPPPPLTDGPVRRPSSFAKCDAWLASPEAIVCASVGHWPPRPAHWRSATRIQRNASSSSAGKLVAREPRELGDVVRRLRLAADEARLEYEVQRRRRVARVAVAVASRRRRTSPARPRARSPRATHGERRRADARPPRGSRRAGPTGRVRLERHAGRAAGGLARRRRARAIAGRRVGVAARTARPSALRPASQARRGGRRSAGRSASQRRIAMRGYRTGVSSTARSRVPDRARTRRAPRRSARARS